MSIPKENIWQELRGHCLDAIPSDCSVNRKAPISLATWQTRGCFIVQSSTRTRFDLVASSVDLGSALLTDAEHLLDGAAEHQVTLWRQINSADWLSPAWLAVTTYYWAFYLLLALTRLGGRTTWFLTKDIVRQFRALAPSAVFSPGAGCYRLLCGSQQTLSDRELRLEKRDARVHDELWRMWFQDCNSKLTRLSPGTSDSAEERLYTAITRSSRNLGEDWPSAFRNVINYRSGFAYTAVRKERVLKSFGFLKTPHAYDIDLLMDKLEQAAISVRSPKALLESPQEVLELLIWTTFVLHLMTTELHRELLDRQKLDARWAASRYKFLCDNGIRCDAGLWPI